MRFGFERFREGLEGRCWYSETVDSLASDPSLDVGKIEPDFDAAEVGAFGANGGGDAGADMARRANVACEFGLNFAKLGNFVHGGLIDFFLGVEAGTHGPLVDEMEE